MKPTPRWGPLPWFVLVLTLLMILLVVVLPPLVLDKTPPAWVLRNADRVARWHGDPEPVLAEWFETTRGEAWEIMTATSGTAQPSPSPSPDASATALDSSPASAPLPSPSPVEDPEREVVVVVMRGRFDSAPPGGPPPPDSPERWIVVAYDALTRVRWKTAVLDAAPPLPDEASTFEFK